MRYAIVEDSQSGHCCFGYTVVDTAKPFLIHGEHYKGRFIAVCECFDEQDAKLICDALNAHEARRIEGEGE